MLAIPLVDLQAEYEALREEVLAALDQVFRSGQLILGPHVSALEQQFAEVAGATYGIGVASGTDALIIALRALNIGPGDEVIVPSYTFFATIEAVVHVGAVPRFVDIEDRHYCLDPDLLPQAITPRTKAIIPVHMYGHPADMTAIQRLAVEYGLRVIEDSCQAHGATWNGQRVGGIGDMGCFSFYVSKNLSAYGEGGMITTNDEALAEQARRLRNHGHVGKYEHVTFGYNSRLQEIQAAILCIKLRRLAQWNEARARSARLYDELLAEVPVVRPAIHPLAGHAFHLYTVRVENRDEVAEALAQAGIGHSTHYRRGAHRQSACAQYAWSQVHLPVCDSVCERVLNLPMHPWLTPSQIEQVAAVLQRTAKPV
ncbi:MAG: DegT/DnrJ/EryC1/StrS family aminotransferase [Candidatus Zipacnadales bacterium]